MRLVLSMILLTVLLLAPRLPAAAAPPVLYEKDRDSTVDLKVGEKLVLHLRNPASGGYDTLRPVFDTAQLSLLSRKNVPPEQKPTPRAGDFGQIWYEWQAVATGETDIVINIRRVWEKKPPEEYWRVHVRVMP